MKRFRYALDIAVIWLFFFIGWSAFYIANQAQAEALGAQRRLADAESAAQAAQVRALRYQVNPHFLFNTLNSLSSLVMTGRTDRAEDDAARAFDLLPHQPVARSRARTSRLAEEIDLQRLYLDIEMARFPDRLHVEIDVPQELEQARMPALLLQPIVENAIKYGVSKSRKAVLIRIEARHLDNQRMVRRDQQPAEERRQGGASRRYPRRDRARPRQRLPAARSALGQPRELPLRPDERRRIQGFADNAGGNEWPRLSRCAY